MTAAQAMIRVLEVMTTTLENDLDGLAAAWIYEDEPSNVPKIESAAREFLAQMRSRLDCMKATQRRYGKRHG